MRVLSFNEAAAVMPRKIGNFTGVVRYFQCIQ